MTTSGRVRFPRKRFPPGNVEREGEITVRRLEGLNRYRSRLTTQATALCFTHLLNPPGRRKLRALETRSSWRHFVRAVLPAIPSARSISGVAVAVGAPASALEAEVEEQCTTPLGQATALGTRLVER
jgi:hypothetical protein